MREGEKPLSEVSPAAPEQVEALDVLTQARDKEAWIRARLPDIEIQGKGLMLGLRLPDTLGLSRKLLERGFLVLPAGEEAEVLALTPPLVITTQQLEAFATTLESLL